MISENVFQERAEKLTKEEILNWVSFTSKEQNIIKKLQSNSTKLLIGPRGSGKSMLMRWTYYECFEHGNDILPVYVNFEKYLHIEPSLHDKSNGNLIFKNWVLSKIIIESVPSLQDCQKFNEQVFNELLLKYFNVNFSELKKISFLLEGGSFSGNIDEIFEKIDLSIGNVIDFYKQLINYTERERVILLLDDAAHAFSQNLQKEFFEIFRVLKSEKLSSKAAVYPGLTNYSPYFNIGHDALFLEVEYAPEEENYLSFYDEILLKRFGKETFDLLALNRDGLNCLYYATNGTPRGIIIMVGYLLDNEEYPQKIATRDYYEAIKNWIEFVEKFHVSLKTRLPRYSGFIETGTVVFSKVLEMLKDNNKDKETEKKAVYIAFSNPIPTELQKVLDFLEYAGLLKERGSISKGTRGVYSRYLVHLGEIMNNNTLAEGKAKTLSYTSKSLQRIKIRQFTRIQSDTLFTEDLQEKCTLDLPPCPNCTTPRVSENARFCIQCGEELKNASLYYEILQQDISVLPLTTNKISKIKKESNIRTIKDILMDDNGIELKKVNRISGYWAEKIKTYAEEFIGG